MILLLQIINKLIELLLVVAGLGPCTILFRGRLVNNFLRRLFPHMYFFLSNFNNLCLFEHNNILQLSNSLFKILISHLQILILILQLQLTLLFLLQQFLCVSNLCDELIFECEF